MTIFQIIEYVEQKGSRKAKIIEMLKQYSIETGSVVETIWVLPSIARIQREIQENRLRSTQPWVDSPRTSTSGAPFIWLESWAYRIVESNRELVVGDTEDEYTQVYGRMTNGDMCNVRNTQRIDFDKEIDYSEIDIF